MNDSRRFRMSTSFYMPVGDFDSKISTMREYLQKPDSGVRYPVLSADAKTKRVSLDLIVDAGTWKSAEDKADSALMGPSTRRRWISSCPIRINRCSTTG